MLVWITDTSLGLRRIIALHLVYTAGAVLTFRFLSPSFSLVLLPVVFFWLYLLKKLWAHGLTIQYTVATISGRQYELRDYILFRNYADSWRTLKDSTTPGALTKKYLFRYDRWPFFEHVRQDLIKKFQNKPPRNVLLLGGGSCVGFGIQSLYGTKTSIDAVELSAEMIELCKKYFWQPTGNSQIIHENALTFVERVTKKYDFILVDVFYDRKVPKPFLQQKFISKLRALLTSKGLLVVNFGFVYGTSIVSGLKLYREVFPHFGLYMTEGRIVGISGIDHRKQQFGLRIL